jgi:hypothetical protein
MNPPGTQVGTQVTWANVTGDSISYDLIPGGTMGAWPENIVGAFWDAYAIVRPITGDSLVAPADRAFFLDGVFPDPGYVGCEDTYIIMFGTGNPPYGDRNQGGHVTLEEGDWNGGFDDNKLILIRFGLDSIPRDAWVKDAVLRLHYLNQRSSGQPVDHHTWVHMITRQWGEGTGFGYDGPLALHGEASWISARTGVDDWGTSGCRGLADIAPPSSYQSQSSMMYGTIENVWVEYDVTEFVRYWLLAPGANFGMKISQDDGGYYTSGYQFGAYNFASSEHSDPTIRPILSVKYEIPTASDPTHWILYR